MLWTVTVGATRWSMTDLSADEQSFRRAFFEAARTDNAYITLCFDFAVSPLPAVLCIVRDEHVIDYIKGRETEIMGYYNNEARLDSVICPVFSKHFRSYITTARRESLHNMPVAHRDGGVF